MRFQTQINRWAAIYVTMDIPAISHPDEIKGKLLDDTRVRAIASDPRTDVIVASYTWNRFKGPAKPNNVPGNPQGEWEEERCPRNVSIKLAFDAWVQYVNDPSNYCQNLAHILQTWISLQNPNPPHFSCQPLSKQPETSSLPDSSESPSGLTPTTSKS